MRWGSLPKSEALVVLSSAAEAGPEYKTQLEHLLSWLRFVGLVRVEGDRVVPGDGAGNASEDLATSAEAPPPNVDAERTMQPAQSPPSPGEAARKDVVLAFSADFHLTASDLSSLSPDQIRALFESVGAIMALTKQAREAE